MASFEEWARSALAACSCECAVPNNNNNSIDKYNGDEEVEAGGFLPSPRRFVFISPENTHTRENNVCRRKSEETLRKLVQQALLTTPRQEVTDVLVGDTGHDYSYHTCQTTRTETPDSKVQVSLIIKFKLYFSQVKQVWIFRIHNIMKGSAARKSAAAKDCFI